MSANLVNIWLLHNARLMDAAELVKIAIQGTHIQQIGKDLAPIPGAHELDLEGRLVIPGFVDAHMHLDKAFALDTELETSNTHMEAVASLNKWIQSASPELIYQNAHRVAELALMHGTVALRTHVMIYLNGNQERLDTMMRVREEMSPWLEVQVVILPDTVVFNNPDGYEIIRGAMQRGAEIIGGSPTFTADPRASINMIYEIAGDLGRDIDVHIDETDDPNVNTLEYLAERKLALGFEGNVTAGHCCSLSAKDEADAERIIGKVAEAGINIVTLPSVNMYLMGRSDRGLIRRGLTRVRELQAGGVNVSYASDNIRDAFTPFGKADMLQITLIAAHALHAGTPDEQRTLLDMATVNPARSLKLADYGLEPGCVASLVVLDEKDWGDAIANVSPRRYVFSHGTLIAQTTFEERLYLDKIDDLLR